jgi:hypothetical protein
MKGCSRSFAKIKSSSRITGTMWSRDSSRFLRWRPANLKYGRMEASQSKCSRSFVKSKSSSRIKSTMWLRDMFSVSTMDSNLIDVYSSYMRFIGSEPNIRTKSQYHNSGFKPRLKWTHGNNCAWILRAISLQIPHGVSPCIVVLRLPRPRRTAESSDTIRRMLCEEVSFKLSKK